MLKVHKDRKLYYQAFTLHEAGSLERLKTAAVPAVKAPEPQKVIDLLIRFDVFTKQGVYWIRGVKPLREKLRRRASSSTCRPTAPGPSRRVPAAGRCGRTWMQTHAIEPLSVPDLRGETPYCEVTKHRTPVEAITVAEGDLAWCGECQP